MGLNIVWVSGEEKYVWLVEESTGKVVEFAVVRTKKDPLDGEGLEIVDFRFTDHAGKETRSLLRWSR